MLSVVSSYWLGYAGWQQQKRNVSHASCASLPHSCVGFSLHCVSDVCRLGGGKGTWLRGGGGVVCGLCETLFAEKGSLACCWVWVWVESSCG